MGNDDETNRKTLLELISWMVGAAWQAIGECLQLEWLQWIEMLDRVQLLQMFDIRCGSLAQ